MFIVLTNDISFHLLKGTFIAVPFLQTNLDAQSRFFTSLSRTRSNKKTPSYQNINSRCWNVNDHVAILPVWLELYWHNGIFIAKRPPWFQIVYIPTINTTPILLIDIHWIYPLYSSFTYHYTDDWLLTPSRLYAGCYSLVLFTYANEVYLWQTGGWLNTKTPYSQYRDYHDKNLYDRNPYTWKDDLYIWNVNFIIVFIASSYHYLTGYLYHRPNQTLAQLPARWA